MAFDEMRHRVELQAAAESQDGYGDTLRSWTTYATVWAAIEPLIGRELYYAQQVQAETTFRITIRYNSVISAKDRIKFGGRYFIITAPPKNIEERKKTIEIFATEVNQ